tara:strand:- start:615 stop:1010 length:396 start_codon:yes stop_codon:yes gene_type:complete
MNLYAEYVLLALLVCLLYKQPEFLLNLTFNKYFMTVLMFLCIYLTYTLGVTCGIIIAFIIILFISSKNEYVGFKEEFTPKISKWTPEKFSSPCQIDLDRKIKLSAERNNIAATKQLDGNTNGGYKQPQQDY